eukprot:403346245
MKQIAIKLVISAFALVNSVSSLQPWELRGEAYESNTAKDKFTTIWNKVTLDTSVKHWSQNGHNNMMAQDMNPTMQWVGDTVPYDDFWGKRDKFIHTEGVTCAVKFVPAKDAKTSYTGTLASGADYGVLRFSVGGEPDPTQPALGNFGPAFGLKFLIDGVPSANLVASNDDTDTWNYFQKDFSNLIAMPDGPIFFKFKTATDYQQRAGLLEFAKYDQQGNYVPNPVFPFTLVFSPTDSVNKLFPDAYTQPFTEQLSSLVAGTVLYNVYAVPEPNADKTLIGTLELTQDATTSYWGDSYLWFQHHDTKYDIAYKPDWKKFLLPDGDATHDKDIDIGAFTEAAPSSSSGCPFKKMKKAINQVITETQKALNI